MLTMRCLEILVEEGWPFTVQTKSTLVPRDIEILKRADSAEVGFTITTADEKIRKMFEPGAWPIAKRIETLGKLRSEKIRTFAMIAPILPGAEGLAKALEGKVEYVILDRLNYHYADRIYKQYGMQWAMEDNFFAQQAEELILAFEKKGIPCRVVF